MDNFFLQEIGFKSLEEPGSIILDFFVGHGLMLGVGDTVICDKSVEIIGARVIFTERESEVAIMIISNNRVGGGDEHVSSEMELAIVNQEGVVNIVLNQVVIRDSAACCAVLIVSSEIRFFVLTNWEDTLSEMDTRTDFTEVNYATFLLELLVSGTVEFIKEFFALVFL